jgi:hypothetical protein
MQAILWQSIKNGSFDSPAAGFSLTILLCRTLWNMPEVKKLTADMTTALRWAQKNFCQCGSKIATLGAERMKNLLTVLMATHWYLGDKLEAEVDGQNQSKKMWGLNKYEHCYVLKLCGNKLWEL